jgi:pimeloyl-ACP methyl ester carboxylesterase
MELPSPADRVWRALTRRALGRAPLRANERASVVFDSGRLAWSLLIDGEHLTVVPGRTGRCDAEICADAETLALLIEGQISGADAFLDGRLTIRGSIALAMKLEAEDESHPRPIEFARPRYVRAGALDTFYLEAGEGPPVVLLHGLGATNASMLPTLVELARDHRVVAPDLPGFGESEKPIRAYDPAFFAHWLASFLDALGVERAVVIGNSMGGRVALELGLTAPTRVDRLVLFAPSLAFKRFRAATPLVRLLAAELGAMPLFAPRGLVTTVLRGMFARPDRLRRQWYDAAVDEFMRVFAHARGRMAFFSAARQIYLEEAHGEAGFWKRLPALRRPALFVWGERDPLVPARFAPHVESALPGVRSVVIEDCGHVPQFEHPARTHALVREFLQR